MQSVGQPEILTVREVKDRLRCGLSTVYDMFKAGDLRGFRLKDGGKGGGIRIFAASLEEFMTRNANASRSEPAPQPVELAAEPVVETRRPTPTARPTPGRPVAGSRLYVRPPGSGSAGSAGPRAS